MASELQNYSVEQEVADFFAKTSVSRSACDRCAKELVGGDVTLIPIQGVCSYTLYAGPEDSTVVQFRLKSLFLSLDTVELAHHVYGNLVPNVSFKGQLGEDENGKEALLIYVMPRVQGMTWLDFILAHGHPKETPEMCSRRLTLVTDVARFFALSWKAPQKLDSDQVDRLRREYESDLQLLLQALPERFHPLIRDCIKALPSIMALPMVLAHKDINDTTVLVDPKTCHLTGVVDWAEAQIEPFGINLQIAESFMGSFHLRNGYIRHVDYKILHNAFWATLKDEVGGWSEGTFQAIQSAMVVGLLLARGFTSRLANMPKPVPIGDDKTGAYNMLHLDSHLIRPETKMIQ